MLVIDSLFISSTALMPGLVCWAGSHANCIDPAVTFLFGNLNLNLLYTTAWLFSSTHPGPMLLLQATFKGSRRGEKTKHEQEGVWLLSPPSKHSTVTSVHPSSVLDSDHNLLLLEWKKGVSFFVMLEYITNKEIYRSKSGVGKLFCQKVDSFSIWATELL